MLIVRKLHWHKYWGGGTRRTSCGAMRLPTAKGLAGVHLPRALDLWVPASLDYKQRLQALFFPEGITCDGNRVKRTAATAPLFNSLAPSESADEKMVSRGGIEPPTRRLRVCCSAN